MSVVVEILKALQYAAPASAFGFVVLIALCVFVGKVLWTMANPRGIALARGFACLVILLVWACLVRVLQLWGLLR